MTKEAKIVKEAKDTKSIYTLDHVKKIFGKWDSKDVQLSDMSLSKHLSMDVRIFPHTFGKLRRKRFQKEKINVVERLVNKIMRSGQINRPFNCISACLVGIKTKDQLIGLTS